MKAVADRQWRRLRKRRLFIFSSIGSAILLTAIAAAILLLRASETPFTLADEPSKTAITSSARISLPPPDLYRPISPQEAMAENAKREFSGRPDTGAATFTLKADAKVRDRALECLTQAVYYEAASEGAVGQRAVAQVVLNRMRHPGYPSSVCGVVYQGSERATGCQFTFTCDGSLARIPIQSLWQRSRRIANDALSGTVYAPVGHATHYHADYVLPYWADALDKSTQVGRHIFYRFKGGLGSASAFRQRYSGVEPTPVAPSTVEASLEAIQIAGESPPSSVESSALQVTAGELIQGEDSKPQLAADISQGTLVIDGDKPASKTIRRSSSTECSPDSAGAPLRPLTANDSRATGSRSKCE